MGIQGSLSGGSQIPPLFYAVTGLALLLIGLSKGGLGGTLGALATPLMALVMPADQVLGLLLPLLMFADVFAVMAHWRRWDSHHLRLLIPASLVGITLGAGLIAVLSPEGLRRGLGLVVLGFVAYRLAEGRLLRRVSYRPRPWHGWLAGTVAGFTSTLAHTGGPPIAVYLLLQDLPPRTFVATAAAYFAVINWLKVPYYAYIGLFHLDPLLRVIWLLPLLPLGVWIGRWGAHRVPKHIFDRIILAALVVTAGLLLFR